MKNKHDINYTLYAKQKRELTDFEIILTDLHKLSDYILDEPYTFDCDFSFFEEGGMPCIKYSLSSHLQLICQDSLTPFDYSFNAANTIIIVEDDRLVEDSLYEPFICTKATIDLIDIIKEEILLDLPLIPKNNSNTCKKYKKHSYYSEQESVVEEKENPFEVLKILK
ncbi:DUF177 domain-containing protein [Allofrancisella guangzhouensis]|uniref:Large ribosomal RNA subunit accumulation protein YceD n=1 Tax=Allofrancisella guangzhouensis TaxID=594679 RepID=A0A0A8E6K2_9GAMM|nr:YceD family protein [Allofrancisella guangzhouensis]AJC49227.1 hypothetical protein SD28_06060 [Allofrancisella guangzhouensis]MBK2027574.1 DUF177 domain-containing protein [Allofrancisella guangzhouensis]MBK2043881.1 DUF177 domain-containing protein [Allofrancisella guangzhouensis]MBK2045009.1 DUF177 domain-containing protein [Allofrancisella guangzhouensis]